MLEKGRNKVVVPIFFKKLNKKARILKLFSYKLRSENQHRLNYKTKTNITRTFKLHPEKQVDCYFNCKGLAMKPKQDKEASIDNLKYQQNANRLSQEINNSRNVIKQTIIINSSNFNIHCNQK